MDGHEEMTVAPRRYPRKMKKTFVAFPFEINNGQWNDLRAAAKAKGMRPQQFIIQAVYDMVERIESKP